MQQLSGRRVKGNRFRQGFQVTTKLYLGTVDDPRQAHIAIIYGGPWWQSNGGQDNLMHRRPRVYFTVLALLPRKPKPTTKHDQQSLRPLGELGLTLGFLSSISHGKLHAALSRCATSSQNIRVLLPDDSEDARTTMSSILKFWQE